MHIYCLARLPCVKIKGIAIAIAELVRSSGYPYKAWTIGVTNNPHRRRNEHWAIGRRVWWWHHWAADDEQIARAVERHFRQMGMKADLGAYGRAGYVYVY